MPQETRQTGQKKMTIANLVICRGLSIRGLECLSSTRSLLWKNGDYQRDVIQADWCQVVSIEELNY